MARPTSVYGSPQEEPVLSQLQSKAQGELLDAIDQLRSDGFSRELSLPQLIVCGNQSSGKSSVLEAIARIHFPARDIFCTKFATELKLRSVGHESDIFLSAKIQPAHNRSPEEKARLMKYNASKDLDSLNDLSKVIEQASLELTDVNPGRNIFQDKLVVDIRLPSLPNLTLVDLPGLVHAVSQDQNEEDISTVHELVKSYMQDENSIILAVLAANNNFANQIVLQLARNVDASGRRTLGIITKPDECGPGSGQEDSAVQCAKNLNVNLELGWHVLRNRDYDEKDKSPDERDFIEAQFFDSRPKWRELPEEDLGATSLRKKLSHVLLRAVGKGLPSLVRDIKLKISDCLEKSFRLGEPKEEESEQRAELREIGVHFRDLVRAAMHGDYLDPFFDHVSEHTTSTRRLRARIRDVLDQFAGYMEKCGHLYKYSEGNQSAPSTSSTSRMLASFSSAQPIPEVMDHPATVTLHELIQAIRDCLQEHRGCELPGLIPNQVIPKIFRTLSSRWESIANHYVHECCVATVDFFTEAVRASAAEHIAENILTAVASPFFDILTSRLNEKVGELVQPYQSGYLITLNTTDLAASIDRTNRERAQSQGLSEEGQNLTALVVLDYVEAYYKIALRTFTENVATLAIESCLMKDLSTVLTLTEIDAMNLEVVQRLMREPEHIIKDRRVNNMRLEKLEKALEVCNRHVFEFGGTYVRHEVHHGQSWTEPIPVRPAAHERSKADPRTPAARHGSPIAPTEIEATPQSQASSSALRAAQIDSAYASASSIRSVSAKSADVPQPPATPTRASKGKAPMAAIAVPAA